MRIGLNLAIIAAALALCAVIYVASGGRFVFVFLPLMLAPLLWRRKG